MAKRISVLCIVTLMLIFGLFGCKDSGGNGDVDVNEVEVKSEAEYKAEADEEITEENMSEELDELEESIEEDVNSIQ